jgi:tetrahydromethanopterin S-methyltransferase subunit B
LAAWGAVSLAAGFLAGYVSGRVWIGLFFFALTAVALDYALGQAGLLQGL